MVVHLTDSFLYPYSLLVPAVFTHRVGLEGVNDGVCERPDGKSPDAPLKALSDQVDGILNVPIKYDQKDVPLTPCWFSSS